MLAFLAATQAIAVVDARRRGDDFDDLAMGEVVSCAVFAISYRVSVQMNKAAGIRRNPDGSPANIGQLSCVRIGEGNQP
jgi:hypothetical protein